MDAMEWLIKNTEYEKQDYDTFHITDVARFMEQYHRHKLEEKQTGLIVVPHEDAFDKFWTMYDKKVGRSKCEKKWKKIDPKEYDAIFSHVHDYVKSTPDKQFRKNPETYINNEGWHDEIINNNPKSGTTKSITDDQLFDAFNRSKNNTWYQGQHGT